MKKQLLFTLCGAMIILLNSCIDSVQASGEVVTRSIEISSFTGFSSSLPANVYVTQDGNERLEIETHENLFDVIRIRVRDGILSVSTDHTLHDVQTLNVYVQAKDLEKLKLSGSGNVFIYDCLISPELDAELSGSGTINLCGSIDDLSARISGSGTININSVVSNTIRAETTGSGSINASGVVKTADIRITGSGDVNGFNLLTENSSAIISGSGNIEVSVSEALNATISGSGNVRYKGDAQVNSNVTGSGSVRKVD